jgi:hypothetical protein
MNSRYSDEMTSADLSACEFLKREGYGKLLREYQRHWDDRCDDAEALDLY